MRISDWSSDVCSSDLHAERARQHGGAVRQDVAEQVVGDDDVELLGLAHELHGAVVGVHVGQLDSGILGVVQLLHLFAPQHAAFHQIGRASCRERVCQYV